jgi:hypothetical protein
MAEQVICTTHGTQDTTVVCQHILQSLHTGERCGFHCSGHIEPGFARDLGLKVLCVACYDLAKRFNLSNKSLDECRH